MKPFLTITFLFTFAISNAQWLDATSEAYFMSMNNINDPKFAEGTPYINENFMPVKLDAFQNIVFTGRYNAFNDQMEIIPAPGKSPVALNLNTNSYVVEFINGNKIYESHNFIDKNGLSGKRFFVNVLKNKVSLLKKEQIKFFDKEEAVSSYQKDKPAKFVRQDDTYYIIIEGENSVAQEMPTKNKDIASLFPNHTKEISDFIKKEKIKANKEQDLIKLFNYISSL